MLFRDRLTVRCDAAWLTLQERVSQSQAGTARVAIARELAAIREEADRTWTAARQPRSSALRQALTKLLMLGVGRSWSVQLIRFVYWIALVWLIAIALPEFFIDVTHPVSAIDSWAGWLGWATGRFVDHLLLALALVILLRYLIRLWDQDIKKA